MPENQASGRTRDCIHCERGELQPARVQLQGQVRGETYTVEMRGLACTTCDYKTIEGSDMPEFGRLLADEYRAAHGLLTSGEIRTKRERLCMSQEEFARYIGVGVASVKRWEMGKIQDRDSNDRIVNEPTHYVSDQIAEGPRQFRKKPVVIEAWQWTGDNGPISNFIPPDKYSWNPLKQELYIHTEEGILKASPGDYIIRGVAGEFYPCKPEIFAKTYECGATRETRGTPPMPKAKFGWMDSLHFEHHIGEDAKPIPIHASEQDCREAHKCIDTDGYCTALEVAVIRADEYRAARVSQPVAPPLPPTCLTCHHAPHYAGLCDFGLADGECPCQHQSLDLLTQPIEVVSEENGNYRAERVAPPPPNALFFGKPFWQIQAELREKFNAEIVFPAAAPAGTQPAQEEK